MAFPKFRFDFSTWKYNLGFYIDNLVIFTQNKTVLGTLSIHLGKYTVEIWIPNIKELEKPFQNQSKNSFQMEKRKWRPNHSKTGHFWFDVQMVESTD